MLLYNIHLISKFVNVLLTLLCRGKWCFNDPNGWCWYWHLWPGRPSGSHGFRFCYGAVLFSEKIAPGTWSLELSAYWLFGSLQLLSQCCICLNAVLVSMALIPCHNLLALLFNFNMFVGYIVILMSYVYWLYSNFNGLCSLALLKLKVGWLPF